MIRIGLYVPTCLAYIMQTIHQGCYYEFCIMWANDCSCAFLLHALVRRVRQLEGRPVAEGLLVLRRQYKRCRPWGTALQYRLMYRLPSPWLVSDIS